MEAVDASRGKFVVGCMTGTSIDGLDVTLLKICEDMAAGGEGLIIQQIGVCSKDMPPHLKSTLHMYCNENAALTAEELCRLQLDFSTFHIEVIEELLDKCDKKADLIAVHGQTVFHKPPLSMQMFAPAPLAEKFNCDVVCDLRASDIAAGGQGAPITPLADYHLFRDPNRNVAVINLGGFCNVSYVLYDGRVTGKDICPVNQLLDAIAQKFLLSSKGYDEDGQIAASYFKGKGGSLVDDVKPPAPELQKYAEYASRSLKTCDNSHSLGTQDSPTKWLDLVETSVGQQYGAYIAYHACYHIAKRIASEVRTDLLGSRDETCCGAVAVVAGGGARHNLLFSMLQAHFGEIEVVKSCDIGAHVGVQDRESTSMAVLGYLCAMSQPITVPAVTGVKVAPISGMLVRAPYKARERGGGST